LFKNFVGVDYGYMASLSDDDDDMSSMHSGKYSALHYASGNEEEAQSPHQVIGDTASKAQPKNTRFGPGETRQQQRQCSMSPHAGRPRRREDDDRHGRGRRMTRNRSMVDMRSQLLHRTLVEELNRRLFFNTVGAVEDIGFRAPTATPTSSSTRGRRSKDDKRHQYVML